MVVISCLIAKPCPATPWIIASQAPLFMGFPRQEYGNWLPFPIPGEIPDPGIEPKSPALAGRFLPLSHQGSPMAGKDDSNS